MAARRESCCFVSSEISWASNVTLSWNSSTRPKPEMTSARLNRFRIAATVFEETHTLRNGYSFRSSLRSSEQRFKSYSILANIYYEQLAW